MENTSAGSPNWKWVSISDCHTVIKCCDSCFMGKLKIFEFWWSFWCNFFNFTEVPNNNFLAWSPQKLLFWFFLIQNCIKIPDFHKDFQVQQQNKPKSRYNRCSNHWVFFNLPRTLKISFPVQWISIRFDNQDKALKLLKNENFPLLSFWLPTKLTEPWLKIFVSLLCFRKSNR